MDYEWDWDLHWPLLLRSTSETLLMSGAALLIGGFLGLVLGVALYATRRGGLFQSRWVFGILNFIVNTVRPIPFLLLLVTVAPLTLAIVGRTIGTTAMIPPMAIAATFGFSRIVEQNLVSLSPGIIEAARAAGASRVRILVGIVIPEALGPLILGFTFLFVAIIDASAVAGYVAGGGLGDFALQYGYKRWNYQVTLVAVLVIIVIVQLVQLLGNWAARKVLRR